MNPNAFTALAAAIAILALPACAAGDGSPEAKNAGTGSGSSSSGSAENDGEYVVVDAAPLGLLDPQILARLSASMATEFSGRYEALASGPRERPTVGAPTLDDRFPLALAITAVPGLAAGEARNVLESMRTTILGPLFGAQGLLAADCKILAKDAAAPRPCTQLRVGGAGNIAFAEVCAERGAGAGHFSVALFSARADGSLSPETRLVFARDRDGGSLPSSVAIQHRYAPPEAPGVARQVYVTYPGPGHSLMEGDSVSVRFGDVPHDPTVPRVSLIDYAPPRIDVGLAWAPSAPADAVAAFAPRYYTLAPGDLEIWQALGAAQDRVQFLAFLPQGVGRQSLVTTPELFEVESYFGKMMQFLATAVMRPQNNAACASTGDALRAAFKGADLPAPVRDAPSDLCEGSPGVDGATVATIIEATCLGGVGVTLDVTLTDGAAAKLPLCAKYLEARALKNPQFLRFNDQTQVLDLSVQPIAALATWAPPAFDFSGLAVELAWEERLRPAADFQAALAACPEP